MEAAATIEDAAIDQPAASNTYLALTFPQDPEVLHTIQHEYTCPPIGPINCPHSNFLKGVKWSPDGACFLTASDDGWLRVYDLPQDALTAPAPRLSVQPGAPGAWDPAQDPDTMGAALRVQEGELIYDCCWYSRMAATDPVSCVFASTSRAHPVHLWDACAGELRASYRGYNDVDEVTAAYALAFSPQGDKLYAGYTKHILAFDVTRPGRDSARLACHVRGPGGGMEARLPGIVSCMAFSPDGSCLASGTYGGAIGLWDSRSHDMTAVMRGHKGGLTQVLFTNDGHFLLSGARQDPHLLCWDLRMLGSTDDGDSHVVYRMERDTATTNQRIAFSLEPCGRHVATGGCDGCVRVFDLQTGSRVCDMAVASDPVNGCDFHPFLPLLAVATGHRRYASAAWSSDSDDSDESESESEVGPSEGSRAAAAGAAGAGGPGGTGAAVGKGGAASSGPGAAEALHSDDRPGKRRKKDQARGGGNSNSLNGIRNVLRVLRLDAVEMSYGDAAAGAGEVAPGSADTLS